MGLLCPKGLLAGCLGPGHQLGCTGLGAGRVCGEWQGDQESPSNGLWLGGKNHTLSPVILP